MSPCDYDVNCKVIQATHEGVSRGWARLRLRRAQPWACGGGPACRSRSDSTATDSAPHCSQSAQSNPSKEFATVRHLRSSHKQRCNYKEERTFPEKGDFPSKWSPTSTKCGTTSNALDTSLAKSSLPCAHSERRRAQRRRRERRRTLPMFSTSIFAF